MTSEVAAPVPEPAVVEQPTAGFRFEPHRCFACGELNEHGLRLQLHADETGCWTELALPDRFQGWESVAHGGISCTILDEVMAWAVIGRGTWGVTARLSATFRRPVPIGRPIRAEGWVTDRRRRAIHTSGRIVERATGETLATADGVFMAVPPDQLAALKARYRLRDDGDEPQDASGRAGPAGPGPADPADSADSADSA